MAESFPRLDLPSWSQGHPDHPGNTRHNYCRFTVNGTLEAFWCRSIRAPIAHRLDVKPSKGRDGAKITDQGVMPARVTILLWIWTGTDELAWNQFYPLLNPKLNPKGRVLAKVQHPILQRAKISSIWIYDIEEGMPGACGVSGVVEIKLEAIEYLESKGKVTTTPKKAPGELRRPNAFDATDVRQTVPSPAKETSIK